VSCAWTYEKIVAAERALDIDWLHTGDSGRHKIEFSDRKFLGNETVMSHPKSPHGNTPCSFTSPPRGQAVAKFRTKGPKGEWWKLDFSVYLGARVGDLNAERRR